MAGYSETPLVKKLGIQEGSKLILAGAPENYLQWLTPLPKAVKLSSRMSRDADLVHLFCTEKFQLQKILRACLANSNRMARSGSLGQKRHPKSRLISRKTRFATLRCPWDWWISKPVPSTTFGLV